ncbi:MAG: ATP-binding protein [Pseudomonadales bacterium]|nr:ATP-binding protein [Pseudomonadales bacterium]
MASLIDRCKGHRGRVVLLALGLGLSLFIFCFSLLRTDWIGTPLLSLGIALLLTYQLIHLSEKSYDDFAQFISNVFYNDFASTSSLASTDEASQRFLAAQKVILGKLRKLRADRSAQHEFLQLLIEQVDTALISFDADNRVEMINQAARNLLGARVVLSLDRIRNTSPELAETIEQLHPGEQQTLRLERGGEEQPLMVSLTEFRLLGSRHRLVSIQNIRQALDEKELESWQKLIRVLTHEIMNSMTPIVSLSHYLQRLTEDGEQMSRLADPESESFNDMKRSIDSIASRSRGLIGFVETYRSLSNLPRPEPVSIPAHSLFDRVTTLLRQDLDNPAITLRIHSEASHVVLADEGQLEQILLNLVKNAVDAVATVVEPAIDLRSRKADPGRLLIEISDNGAGMDRQLMDNIFTPFFTTKDTGTGVGLSLSRQLARLNHGTLTATSTVGKGSCFTLNLRAGSPSP